MGDAAEARSASLPRPGGWAGTKAMAGAGVDPGEDMGLWLAGMILPFTHGGQGEFSKRGFGGRQALH